MKPIDEAIFGMVSESSGRNGANREVASIKNGLCEGRIPWSGMKAVWHVGDWLTRQCHSGAVLDPADPSPSSNVYRLNRGFDCPRRRTRTAPLCGSGWLPRGEGRY
jgi:hypothetical protein